MNSIIFGVIFWVVLLGAAWLVRPESGLLRVTMEKWSAAHIMVTVLVLAALIGSSSFLMTLCPMWNGEITAKLMEETEARSSEKASATGEEEWMKNAAAAMSSDDPDTDPDRYAVKNKNQYELMADALLKGQIYLEYGDMDRRLLQMPNPYDTNARRALGVRYHWDHAFYKGRYYMYFGVVPVFLLFIPFKLITGASLTTYHATQVFVGMSIIGLFLFFRLLSKRFFPKLSFAVYLFLGAAVSVTSMVHCVAKPAMYMTAFSSAFCMIALGNLIVIPCLIVFLREHKFTWKLFLKLVAAASPYIIIGALLMLYNYVRFENPFEFGQSYQLTVADQTAYGSLLSRLSVRGLLNGATYFLTRSEDLIADFPHIVEGGVFYTYPVFGVGLFALTNKKTCSAIRANKVVLFLLGGIVTIGVIIMMDIVWTPYLLARYREDMMWLLGMLVFLAVGMRYAEISGEELAVSEVEEGTSVAESGVKFVVEPCEEAKEFSSAVCLLSIYSMLVCAFVFVQLDMKHFLPEQIELIKKIVGAMTFGL